MLKSNKLSSDNGKPVETRGRKAIGPFLKAASCRKESLFLSKRVFGLFLFSLFAVLIFGQAFANASEVFNLSKINQGIVGINIPLKNNKTKIMIQKDGKTYYYDVKTEKDMLPLQMGSGIYLLALLENIEGSKYAVNSSKSVQVNLDNEKISFLQSVRPVYWRKESKAAKLAKELTENMDTDEKKACAIYDYIINNIEYDRNKLTNLNTDYIPNVDEIIASGKGICFDYAAVYAAMLRSIDIPAKLVMGYKEDIDAYHSWNEVFLGKKGWVTIDTTYDAVLIEYGTSSTFEKDPGEYKKEKEY